MNNSRIIGLIMVLILLLTTMTSCLNGEVEEEDRIETVAADNQDLILPVYYVKFTDHNEYLVREEHQAPYTEDVYMAAMEQLIKGKPVTAGASRVLPDNTVIHNITVINGEMTVDFSGEVLQANVGSTGEELGIASIVNTLTEFPGIDSVSFMVDGKIDDTVMSWWGHVGLYEQPFKRDLSVVVEPAIWVTQPSPGQKVTTPLTVSGSAMVFEATVCARIVDSAGKELVGEFTNAAAGAPERGDFTMSLDFSTNADSGKLIVYCEDARDGGERDVVEVPIIF